MLRRGGAAELKAVGCQPTEPRGGWTEGDSNTEKYERDRPWQGHDFSKGQPCRYDSEEGVQYQGAEPPGQLLHR